MSRATVHVEILGQPLSVTSDEGEAHVQRVAAELDRRMREIANGGKAVSSFDAAVIAALNIASEYQKLKQEYEQVQDIIDRLNARLTMQSAD
jgi:cell division protein ZapA